MFLAITNINPAVNILLLENDSGKTGNFARVGGSIAVVGTVATIIIIYYTPRYDWLLGHIIFNFFQSYFLHILKIEMTDTTYIYYRNFFSIAALLPISIFLDVLHLPTYFSWKYCLGCLMSGVLGTFLQLWTFKVESKSNSVNFQSLAKLLSSFVAYEMFFANIEPVVWFLIVVNLTTGVFAFTKPKECPEVVIETVKLPNGFSAKEEEARGGY